jgi:Galactose oxidase-like, Early set domain
LAPLALAAAGALALGGAPALLGGGSAGEDPAELARYEAGAHAYHADETVAGERRNEAVLDRCESDPAYRAANWESCPASAGAPPASAGPELRSLAAAAAADVGQWSALKSVPSLAIHSVVLPTGKVLWFSRTPDNDGGTAHLYDPATGQSASVPPPMVEHGNGQTLPANIWCGGQAQLPDGRVLVAGGNLAYPTGDGSPQGGRGYKGAAWVFVFDPFTETWERLERSDGQAWDMVHGRWYPTLTTLSDGRVLIVGGWDERGYQDDVREVEVFTPRSTPGGRDRLDTVGSLPGYVNIYPHMFLLPKTTLAGQGAGDRVLLAGPGRSDALLLHTEDWSWHRLPRPRTSRFWGTAVMEPGGPEGPAHVTLLGGADVEASPSAPEPTATSEYLDLNDQGWADQDGPAPVWRDGASLDHARAHFNTVLLPDGSKLSSGGGLGQAPDGSLYTGPVYEAELFDPATGDWRPAGKENDARTYHSTAVLLPDGRVLTAGDDRPDHLPAGGRTAQLYSPPYLALESRPVVTDAPRAVRYGARLPISASDPAAIAKVVLMRPGATTHAVDMEQRSVELARRPGEAGLVLTSPPDPSVAPPGWYMLFALDARGVPSVARWIQLDPAAPEIPAPTAATPAAATPAAAPPVGTVGAADRRAPRLRVRGTRATVRGRTLTVRLRLTSDERATVTARLGRVGTRTGVRPGRTATVLLRTRLGARRPHGVRVALSARDGAGNRSDLRAKVAVPGPR